MLHIIVSVIILSNVVLAMPSYSKMTLAELRQICEDNGIEHEGLTKRQLLELLREYDQGLTETRDKPGGENSDDVESDGGSDEIPDDNSSVHGFTTPPGGAAAESESVVQLRLQLALIQAQKEARIAETQAKREELAIEKERRAIQASPQDVNQAANFGPTPINGAKLTLPSLSNDDALSFFHAFERTLEINDVQRAFWIKYLPAQLSPKALKAFTRLSLEDSRDYDVVKRTILSYYKLDAHAYLKSFRTQRRTGNETYKMFLNRMSETFSYWQEAKDINSLQSLSDAILAEQFLQSLPENVRSFVRARQPKCAAECADYADLCYEVSVMSSSGDPTSKGTGRGQWPTDHNRFVGNGRNVHFPRQGMYDQGNAPNYSSRVDAGNHSLERGDISPGTTITKTRERRGQNLRRHSARNVVSPTTPTNPANSMVFMLQIRLAVKIQ